MRSLGVEAQDGLVRLELGVDVVALAGADDGDLTSQFTKACHICPPPRELGRSVGGEANGVKSWTAAGTSSAPACFAGLRDCYA